MFETKTVISTIFAPAADLTTNADDLLGACSKIVGKVAVVLRPIRFGHQNVDVVANELGNVVSKQALGCRIYAFDDTAVIDGNDRGNGGFEDAAKLGSLGLGRRHLVRGR